MKNIFIGILIITSCLYSMAQVGINTNQPKGVFHIDGKKDGSSTPASVANDVIVTNDGNLGIGTITPTAKVHIVADAPSGNFGLAIQDGKQQNNRVLISDANGNGHWADLDVSQFSLIPYKTNVGGVGIPITGTASNHNTDFIIDFPQAGTYSVSIASRVTIGGASHTIPVIYGYLKPVSPTIVGANFPGSVESRGRQVGNTIHYQLFINQNIDVSVATGLQARLYIALSNYNPTSAVNQRLMNITWGNSSSMTAGAYISGGTYIRVK